MSDPTTVLLDVTDGVATITLNRPHAANALDMALAVDLEHATRAAIDDPDARVILLNGSGRMFCAGGDLAAIAASGDRPAFLHELASAAHRAVLLLENSPKPIVAVVHGAAAGAGLSLTLVADLVLVGSSARLTAAYTNIGLTPDCGMSWLLPRIVGTRRAMELLMTPRRLTADEAVAWGLATEVVADDDLQSRGLEVARSIAAGAAGAIGATRQLVRQAATTSFGDHLDAEAIGISRAAEGSEADDLIDAFLSRRS